MADSAEQTSNDGKITCHIDGARVHSVQLHIQNNHPDWTLDRYREEYPKAPLLSERAQKALRDREKVTATSQLIEQPADTVVTKKEFLHDVFGFGDAPAARSAVTGDPIEIAVMEGHSKETIPYIAQIDPNYVFNIDLVKKIVIGLEINMPIYLWGYHGTGKTTALEQVSARTGRPFMRVQHTINTEESHILGQFLVRPKDIEEEEIAADGSRHTVKRVTNTTDYQLGPLPLAMLYGMVYCADEYDFAMPSVTAVYQPVLEGKPLVIKEAPEEFRVIRPHPNFRFVATGNTNGVGDETGLYQGTMIQNAANYSRFPITEEVEYMDKKIEESILISQTGIDKPSATKIVKYADEVRKSFKDGRIGMTVSPRELINAATLGIAFGGDWMRGLQLSFANRLSRVDKKVVEEYAQRIFG